MNNNNHKIRGSNVLDLRKIVAERKEQEKWKRKLMAKREMERYLAYWSRIKKEQKREFWKIRFLKLRTFLSWGARLLVPDFLIGHPNLWDNLKTLRKHPQFQPLRIALVAWLIFSITIGSTGIYSILTSPKIFAVSSITQTTDAHFNAGTLADVAVSGTGIAAGVELTSTLSPVWIHVSSRWLPVRVDLFGVPAFADIDNDGDFDLAMGGFDGFVDYFENTGTITSPIWTHVSDDWLAYDVGGRAAPAFADIDNDGDFDLAVGENDGSVNYFENTGCAVAPIWTHVSSNWLPASVGWRAAPAFVDIDNDGDFDLAVGENCGWVEFFENIGTITSPIWTHVSDDWLAYDFGREAVPAFADIDNDGDFDLAVGDRDGLVEYFRNDGTAASLSWTHVSDNWLPVDVGLRAAPAFADIDNDGDFDLAVGDNCGFVEYFRNDPVVTYSSSGNLVSSVIDTEQESNFTTLDFTISEVPPTTNIHFQLRSAATKTDLATAIWHGPTGIGDYYTDTGTAINSVHDGHRFIQYKAFLSTADTSVTPSLSDITINFTLFNQPPDTPVNSLPTNGATGQDLNVSLTGSAYSDPEGDSHTDTQWQIDDDSDFSSPVWTRIAGAAEISTFVATSTGTFDNELAGKTELDHNTVYYWQVRYSDSVAGWSEWSVPTQFTTNIIHTPINISPAHNAIGQNLNVILKGSLFFDEQPGATHQQTKWRVDDDADFATPVWERTSIVGEITITVNAVEGIFANELAGKTQLDRNTTYHWQVKYQSSMGCWSEWSTSTQFTTNILPAPTNVSPADMAIGQNLNVILKGSVFFDEQPGATHQQTKWQVDDDINFATPVWTRTAVGEITTTVNAVEGIFANELADKTQLDRNTTYHWQVKYQSSTGCWSEWSTSTQFTTNILPAPTNVSPLDGATVITFTPLLEASPFNDPQGHTHRASHWQVDDNADFSSPVYDSGVTAFGETSRAVPGGILRNFTIYHWRVKYQCSGGFWSDWSISTFFEISITAVVIEVRPIFGNVTVDQGDRVNIVVQVINFADGSPLNTAVVKIDIFNPDGIKIVDGVSMAHIVGSDGIYRFPFTIPAKSGGYLYEVTAVEAGKFGYGAANFEVRTLAADIAKIESDLAAHEAAQATERAAQETERVAQEAERAREEAERVKQEAERAAQEAERTKEEAERVKQEAERAAQEAERVKQDAERAAQEIARANMDILIGAMIVTQSAVNDTVASTTAFVTNLVNFTDDFYKNAVLTFTSGALDGQSRRISAYDGTLKKITLDPALTSAPANGDAFTIVTQNVRIEEQMIEHEAAQATERAAQADFRTVMRADTALTLSKLDSILADINRIGTPSTIVYRVEADAMFPVLNQISADLKQVLTGVEAIDFAADPTFQTLLDISKINASDLGEVKNKLADLQAVSSVTRRIVEQVVVKPTIETWMTFDSVVFNFLIANPADTEREINFKAHLPAEVKPEHILDLSGLNIDFDIGANTFYVHKQITLGPRDSIKYRVEIKDIWFFADEEIESLKQQAQTLVEPLAGTQYEAQGAVLKSAIEATLNIILINQQEGYRSPQDHIITYRINQEKMEHVKRNLERLKDLVVQAGAARGVVGRIGGIQTFATWGIILAIVFGFGLLAAVIFAMWRHQTMLAMAAMGISRKEVMAQMGKKRERKASKRNVLKSVISGAERIDQEIEVGAPIAKASFAWRLPWKKILIWIVIIGIAIILGFLAIKYVPALFQGKTIILEREKIPAVAPITPLNQEEFNEGSVSPLEETGTGVEMIFEEEVVVPKLKILDTPTDWLRVRKGPGATYPEITKVYPNEQYEYTDEQNGWYFIVIPGKEDGWVFGGYVQTIRD